MAQLIRQTLRIDSGIAVGDVASLHLAVEVQVDPQALRRERTAAVVCLPGGGMNRRYYDLRTANDDSYSFAAQMALRGFIVVLVDHPGVGESDRPSDGYALTHEVITRAEDNAVEQVLAGLRAGTLIAGLAPLPDLRSIIVGHSMGAMLACLQQVSSGRHAGVAALGFGTRGLPGFLPRRARELSHDVAAVRAELVSLAKSMFVEPYPVIRSDARSSELYGSGGKAEAAGIAALKAAGDCVLPVPALLSMLPDNIVSDTNRITVPIFIAAGERDMVGNVHEIPASFSASRDVTLLVLPETGHSHFLFATRHQLFKRLADWAQSVPLQS